MWAQLLNAAIGLWLMAAPAVLGYGGASATNDRIVGPIIAGLAGAAVGECTRGVRWALLPFGLWLVVSPLVISGAPAAAITSDVACGAAVLALALVRGRVKHSYGGGWRVLLKPGSFAVAPPP